jgi:hypothetical protein
MRAVELVSITANASAALPKKETTLTTETNEARARAEASFRKEERAKEGAKAMMEYQANSRMIREKTERLKALRLAKEAADKARARLERDRAPRT